MFKPKQSLSLIYAIVLGIFSLCIIAIVLFPLNEAWLIIKGQSMFSSVDSSTLNLMGDIIQLLPVAFVFAVVVGLFTTAQFQKNEAY